MDYRSKADIACIIGREQGGEVADCNSEIGVPTGRPIGNSDNSAASVQPAGGSPAGGLNTRRRPQGPWVVADVDGVTGQIKMVVGRGRKQRDDAFPAGSLSEAFLWKSYQAAWRWLKRGEAGLRGALGVYEFGRVRASIELNRRKDIGRNWFRRVRNPERFSAPYPGQEVQNA